MLDHGDGTASRGSWNRPCREPLDAALTRDDVLDNITLYWLINTGFSSARLY
ncbi:MAG: hypothetical protein ACRDOU_17605 [Streptosporangiaceae bacterium]